jgi:hypothetical protein
VHGAAAATGLSAAPRIWLGLHSALGVLPATPSPSGFARPWACPRTYMDLAWAPLREHRQPPARDPRQLLAAASPPLRCSGGPDAGPVRANCASTASKTAAAERRHDCPGAQHADGVSSAAPFSIRATAARGDHLLAPARARPRPGRCRAPAVVRFRRTVHPAFRRTFESYVIELTTEAAPHGVTEVYGASTLTSGVSCASESSSLRTGFSSMRSTRKSRASPKLPIPSFTPSSPSIGASR